MMPAQSPSWLEDNPLAHHQHENGPVFLSC
jgi:hypothetical protein